jgi:medium-chain acyl-[acyl-carrier-protein] hydrolase
VLQQRDSVNSNSHLNYWFVCPRANPAAEIRLFLFPYAGGGPAVFHHWVSEFPSSIEVWIAHYPGRGSRHSESPMKQVVQLAEVLSQAIQPFLDKPLAFFGHSLGGLIAFEFARQLRQMNLPQPQILFVSGCGAPHIPDPNPPIHTLPDVEFLKSLQQWNAISSELLNQPDVIDLLLPTLRADFEAVENYVYAPDRPTLDCPILAFGGLDDLRVSHERIDGWAWHTNGGFHSQYFPGDHFFINTAKEAMIASITAELASSHV